MNTVDQHEKQYHSHPGCFMIILGVVIGSLVAFPLYAFIVYFWVTVIQTGKYSF